ncbi:hypothetical protein ID866_7973 [Astraeus odoratus]|nr:hypothetical protein ID866_7973 [Astraeus odoratus]
MARRGGMSQAARQKRSRCRTAMRAMTCGWP